MSEPIGYLEFDENLDEPKWDTTLFKESLDNLIKGHAYAIYMTPRADLVGDLQSANHLALQALRGVAELYKHKEATIGMNWLHNVRYAIQELEKLP